MTDLATAASDGETPVNPYSLLEAVNRSSDTAHMAWLIFLGIMAYLMIAVAGVTHRDLLLETPVSLPIMGVDIPLAQFFQFAPIVLVLFHLGVISQLVLLARKTLELDRAIRLLESSDSRRHPLRLELHNFFFVQALAGPKRSAVMGSFLHAMSWLTLVILPVVLILYIQVVFLPYHSGWITWTHRIALVFDIALLALIGVFLMRAEASFFEAFWYTAINNPISVLVTSIVLGVVTIFSFFIATVPGETLDRISRGIMKPFTPAERPDSEYYSGFVVPFMAVDKDGALFGIFHRNLLVIDKDLVVDREVSKGEPTLSLRGRDLRYARLDRSDMHQADLTGANLDRASLRGTDLRNAQLQCADVTELLLSENREGAQCTSARGADLSEAQLTAADLTGIDARGAKFEYAKLENAQLPYSLVSGTNFSSATLDKANLTGGIQAQGANFLIARLQGADLTGAKLQGADFRSASMQAVGLNYADLRGAVMQDAELAAGTLQKANLQGADLSQSDITGADLRQAKVWMTAPPARDTTGLADLNGTVVKRLTKDDIVDLVKLTKDLGTGPLGTRISETLKPLIKNGTKKAWGGSEDADRWDSVVEDLAVADATPPVPTPVGDRDPNPNDSTPVGATGSTRTSYATRLTTYLTNLMCRPQWADGGIATGVARRAQGQNFRGDLVAIYHRLISKSCPAYRRVSPQTIQDLSTAAGRLTE